MAKQPKTKEEPRQVGPKFARSVIPEQFQIRRTPSPMASLLDEASRIAEQNSPHNPQSTTREPEPTPVKFTGVKFTGVNFTGVGLPDLGVFLDEILPRFNPVRQAVLLRLYRWSEGTEREIVVSTTRLAAKTNMDEKSCRTHLHALIAEGYLLRSMDGELIAKFGGSDRTARGLILRLSGQALSELL